MNTIKAFTIRIDDDLLKLLRIITIKDNTSIQSIVIEFLKKYVEEHQEKE